MPIAETSSAAAESPGSMLSESKPLNIRNERTAAIIKEITWFVVSAEAKSPIAE